MNRLSVRTEEGTVRVSMSDGIVTTEREGKSIIGTILKVLAIQWWNCRQLAKAVRKAGMEFAGKFTNAKHGEHV